jgi:hypothetical protein
VLVTANDGTNVSQVEITLDLGVIEGLAYKRVESDPRYRLYRKILAK